jgi:hypothetical protein
VRRPAIAVVLTLALASLGAALVSCSLFHEDFPGSCTIGTDCWKGIETCDVVKHVCVPLSDAAPVPDAGPDASSDGGPDASDGGPDASDGGPDAAPDARPIDAGVPDAT